MVLLPQGSGRVGRCRALFIFGRTDSGWDVEFFFFSSYNFSMPENTISVLLVMEWNFSEPGGVQQHVRELGLKLKERGHRVWGLLKKRVKEAPPFESFYLPPVLPCPVIAFPPPMHSIARILMEINPDVVHIHHIFTPISIAVARACMRLSIPYVFTNHTLPVFHEKRFILRHLPLHDVLQHASFIVSVSRAADEVVGMYVKDTGKRLVIPNGVNTDVFRPMKVEKPERPVVLFVGRLVERKGVDVLIKAKRLVDKEIDCEFWVVGKGRDEWRFRSLAGSLGVEVKFCGKVPNQELPRYYNLSDVVAVPSKERESFGIVAAEAMACGRPVVVSDVGGLPEVVEDGKEGLVVKRNDPEELARALITLLRNPDLRKKMGENGRKKSLKEFDWNRVTERIENLYRKVAGKMDKNPIQGS